MDVYLFFLLGLRIGKGGVSWGDTTYARCRTGRPFGHGSGAGQRRNTVCDMRNGGRQAPRRVLR